MMKSHLLALLSVALLASTARAADPEWEPNVYPENQLFASYVVSTTMINLPDSDQPTWGDRHLGDEQGVLGVDLKHVPKGAKITVEVKPGPFIEGGSITVTAPKSGSWLIHPKVAYDFDALVKVHQPRPLNIKFAVSIDGVPLGEKIQTVTLRDINDCLYGVAEGDDVYSDYNYLFAAYVNESHPWVDEILREALETGIVGSFDGYQDDETDVIAQIYAIWDVMQRRGLKYSSITTTASETENVQSQHVRLFDDAIHAKQANCVDGTVMLAAILRKIGLNPELISLSDHMFLSVDLTEDGKKVIGLETTMMGGVDYEEGEHSKYISDDLRLKWNARTSWNSFEGAVVYGTEQLREDEKKAKKDPDFEFESIDIAEARAHGILPITSPEDTRKFEVLKDNGEENITNIDAADDDDAAGDDDDSSNDDDDSGDDDDDDDDSSDDDDE